MVNWPALGVALFVAVNVKFVLVPSGKLNRNEIVSPAFGLPPDKSISSEAGAPVGPVVAALVRFDVTDASLSPNGEEESSATDTSVALGWLTTRRPRPSVPRSAWARSEISCLRPA